MDDVIRKNGIMIRSKPLKGGRECRSIIEGDELNLSTAITVQMARQYNYTLWPSGLLLLLTNEIHSQSEQMSFCANWR